MDLQCRSCIAIHSIDTNPLSNENHPIVFWLWMARVIGSGRSGVPVKFRFGALCHACSPPMMAVMISGWVCLSSIQISRRYVLLFQIVRAYRSGHLCMESSINSLHLGHLLEWRALRFLIVTPSAQCCDIHLTTNFFLAGEQDVICSSESIPVYRMLVFVI